MSIPHRIWCKVGAIKNTTIYAFTANDELVMMRKGDLEGIQNDDIISFIPLPPRPGAGFNRILAKWFGAQPRIIGLAVPYPVARGGKGTNPFSWKEQKDNEADHDGFREVHACPADSIAGAARA